MGWVCGHSSRMNAPSVPFMFFFPAWSRGLLKGDAVLHEIVLGRSPQESDPTFQLTNGHDLLLAERSPAT